MWAIVVHVYCSVRRVIRYTRIYTRNLSDSGWFTPTWNFPWKASLLIPWKLDTKRAFGIDMTIGTTGSSSNLVCSRWEWWRSRFFKDQVTKLSPKERGIEKRGIVADEVLVENIYKNPLESQRRMGRCFDCCQLGKAAQSRRRLWLPSNHRKPRSREGIDRASRGHFKGFPNVDC